MPCNILRQWRALAQYLASPEEDDDTDDLQHCQEYLFVSCHLVIKLSTQTLKARNVLHVYMVTAETLSEIVSEDLLMYRCARKFSFFL